MNRAGNQIRISSSVSNSKFMKHLILTSLALAALLGTAAAAEPKRLLIVTVSTGFRHSSIELTEQVLRELAKKSGDIVVTSTSESTNYPRNRLPTMGGTPGLSRDQQIAVNAMNAAVADLNQKVAAAQNALSVATFTETPDQARIKAKIDALSAAEMALAAARVDAIAKLQASANRLSAEQLAGLQQSAAGGGGRGGGRGGGAGGGIGGDGGGNPNGSMELVMQEYFAPDKLQNYDGMWFISTVGELPFPDRDAFFKWVADGHAVMGNHGASDSMHQTPEWAKMLGAEFQNHNQQATGMIRNIDPAHPADLKWGTVIPIHEELYMFFTAKPANGNRNPYLFDQSAVHSLLTMTEAPPDGGHVAGSPGWFPVSWTKMYGKGRIFFSSLGHREDVVDPAWTDGSGQRLNSPDVAFAVQDHFLGGMRWALGLTDADTKPQTQK